MRISDWSSDVCSSDLLVLYGRLKRNHACARWQARDIALRHQIQRVAMKTDYFGIGPMILARCDFYLEGGANSQAQAGGFQHQAGGSGDAAAEMPDRKSTRLKSSH